MKRLIRLCLLSSAAALAGCGANQALLVSGGERDLREISRINDDYGTGDADATVPVKVGEETYTYRVWLHKTKPRIMVQTASMAGLGTAGMVRGLTSGLVQPEIEYEPIQQAAKDYLTSTRRGCVPINSRKLTNVGWEWDIECPAPTPARRRR